MSGSAGLFNKKKFFFTSSGVQGWAEREMGNTKKNTATLTETKIKMLLYSTSGFHCVWHITGISTMGLSARAKGGLCDIVYTVIMMYAQYAA